MTNIGRDNLTKVKTGSNIVSVSQPFNLLLLSLKWAFAFGKPKHACAYPRVLSTEARTVRSSGH